MGICVARAGSRIVAYLPHATRLRLRGCGPAAQAGGADAEPSAGAGAMLDEAAARPACGNAEGPEQTDAEPSMGAAGIGGTRRAYALDLEQRRVAHLMAQLGADGSVVVPQHPFAHDALVVLEL